MGKVIGGVLAAVLAVLVVGWLVLHRGDIAYPTLEARYATPHSRYLDLPGGVRMHVREEGLADGAPLVLVHGYSASTLDWDGWVQALGARHRLVLLDLPGHGLTRAPKGYAVSDAAYVREVDAAATALKLPPFVIAGNSMGGGVAWRYALAHPARVRGVVLVDSAGFPPPKAKSGATIFTLLQNPVARVLLRDLDVTSLTRQGLEAAFLDKRFVTDALVRRYTDFARAPGHRDMLLALQGDARDVATAERLAGIAAPTLVMFGADDRLIPAENGERFAHAIPHATLIVYPGVGHVPMEQIPGRSAADLEAWLKANGLP